MLPNTYHIYPVGDQGLTIEFGQEISSELNSLVLGLWRHLQADPIPGTLDLVPAYASLTLVYDLVKLYALEPGSSAYDTVCSALKTRLSNLRDQEQQSTRLVTIPVCYHQSLAPDLEFVASEHQLTTNDVVRIHTAGKYRVYMIGFLPGFPYMGKVDQQIATPRRHEPRNRVPAGSVGIAGEQTGIYPLASPGGWQLIGQTPLKMFDTLHPNPTLLNPGDDVQFVPMSLQEFNRMNA